MENTIKNTTDNSIKNVIENIHELNHDSFVIDVGGYIGKFADAAQERWNCRLILYEPAEGFYQKLTDKYKDNPNITVIPFGIAGEYGYKTLFIREDATSVFSELTNPAFTSQRMAFLPADLELGKYPFIDLLALNCEGCEYEIIKKLTITAEIDKVKQLLVQYHKINDSDEKLKECEELLSKTHISQWSRGHSIWTLYKKKPATDEDNDQLFGFVSLDEKIKTQ